MDIRVSDLLTLEGKSLKGKNRVREHGSKWVVVKLSDKVSVSQPIGDGPFFLVRPVAWPDDNGSDDGARWIASQNDPDFSISKCEFSFEVSVR